MSDLFNTLDKGSNKNLKVTKPSLKEWFASNYDSTTADVDTMLSQIGYAESKNKNIAQTGGGPGRGLFQFEKTMKEMEKAPDWTEENKKMQWTGDYVQAGGMTARNRLAHWYTKQKRPVPSWLNQEGMKDPSVGFDASQLTDEQQGELLMADFWQKKGSDPLIFSALDEVAEGGDAGELWLKKHWAGAEEGTQKYKDKKAQWGREMDTMFGSKKKGMGNFSEALAQNLPFVDEEQDDQMDKIQMDKIIFQYTYNKDKEII